MSDSILREEWRKVEGFEGYEVSNLGRVGSCLRTGPRRPCRLDRRILTPDVDRDGYLKLTLQRDGKQVKKFVHHLVLEAFVGPRPDGTECRHLDNNRANNRPENLCWSTHVINVGDKRRHGTHQEGERHGMADLTEDDVAAIRSRRASGERLKDIAVDYDTTESNISMIALGRTWKCADAPVVPKSARSSGKLTPSQVREILALRSSGRPQHSVAAEYGIHQVTVSMIWRGKMHASIATA